MRDHPKNPRQSRTMTDPAADTRDHFAAPQALLHCRGLRGGRGTSKASHTVRRPAFIELLVRSQPFRVFQLFLGGFLMITGPIVGIPTPGPLGILIFGVGFALVLRNSRWVRKRYVRHTRRYPQVQRAVNFGLRRKTKRRVPVHEPKPEASDA
jgi:hypothetical protein